MTETPQESSRPASRFTAPAPAFGNSTIPPPETPAPSYLTPLQSPAKPNLSAQNWWQSVFSWYCPD